MSQSKKRRRCKRCNHLTSCKFHRNRCRPHESSSSDLCSTSVMINKRSESSSSSSSSRESSQSSRHKRHCWRNTRNYGRCWKKGESNFPA
ncbi:MULTISPECIES: hypothetical protein [Bacillus]|uniref:hypothetical protein n=1 Tax=Bacillus TaxID=1386 RepID=UPI0011DDE264|nr:MULTISPECIES: hypothetical protein [Bacillus]